MGRLLSHSTFSISSLSVLSMKGEAQRHISLSASWTFTVAMAEWAELGFHWADWAGGIQKHLTHPAM